MTEYDTRQSPYTKLNALPKGHPKIPSTSAEWVTKNNIVRGMYYNGDAAGTGWAIRGSSVTAYDYNASGLPLSSTTKDFDENGLETSSAEAVYEYESCQ